MKGFWFASLLWILVCIVAACAPVWVGDKKDDSSSRIVEDFQEKSLVKALSRFDEPEKKKQKVKYIVKKEKLTCEEIEKRMFEKCIPDGEVILEEE